MEKKERKKIKKLNKLRTIIAAVCVLSMLGTNSLVFAENEEIKLNGENAENIEDNVENQNEIKIEGTQEVDENQENKTEQENIMDLEIPDNRIGETVISVDEQGNVFSVEDKNDGVIENTASIMAKTDEPYIVNFRANAAGTSVGNNPTEYTEYLTGRAGYCYGGSGADAAYLGTENGKVKFMQSGVVGLVDQAKVQIVRLDSVKSYSNYYADGSSIIHRICMNMTTSGYGGSVNIGPQQSYMKTGTTYYSYDGHYFYIDYATMIEDYKNNTRKNAVNSDNPYYNYYQYLPLRGKSNYSASELSAIINKHTKNTSKMYGKGSQFVNCQNTYGVNALIMTGVGALESAWGTSNIAVQKNNLFGLNAVDTSPGTSANTFSSVDVCIKDFAETYMSKRYLRAGYTYYRGGFLGDKASGINVSYASDAYWGEKIASLAWVMDGEGGKKDQNQYMIGIKDTLATNHTTLNIRKEASTSSISLYNTGTSSNYAFLILGEADGFYKIQSDPVLNNERTSINSSSGIYNSLNMYAYTSKDYIRKINIKSENTQNRLVLINGVYYCYNGENKIYGEQRIDGAWYYFDKTSGAMQTGLVNLGNKTVYYGTDGAMRYGEQRINNAWYYFDKISGAMQTGLVNLGNKIVYYGTDGAMRYGEQRINNAWYYFDKISGAMQTGLVNLGNKTVYYGADGAMRYGEQRINNTWYYFDKISGAMIKNAWYEGHYYDENGVRIK